ncbi:MAG: zinc-dependent peptidase [Planctomycetes bacterium]|nr:zinc-dependent peptidase [Planctomycetota bacterium]
MIVTQPQVRTRVIRSAVMVLLGAIIAGLALYALSPSPYLFWFILLPGMLYFAHGIYSKLTKPYRRRLELMNDPFPAEWEDILVAHVAFYNALSEKEKGTFRKEVQIFLEEIPVVGCRCEVDDTTRVLVAASAVIPIFGFPFWEYSGLSEVIITPQEFDATMDADDGLELNALGMVGTEGMFNGVVILSKPDLLRGFSIHGDKQNVGIHEFAHLIDKATGNVDGVPVSLPADCFKPWLNLLRTELGREYKGDPDIDEYGLTCEEEFFAVTSEYFFEAPEELHKKHPELYGMMEKIYRQNTESRLASIAGTIFIRRKKGIKRNAPCPCGSGKKYKKCCGRKK